MDKTTLQEIAAIWDKLSEIERKQSNYTEAKHTEVKADMGEDWNITKIYKVGEYVMDGNRLWICTIQNVNTRPYDGSPYWSKVNIASEFNRLAALINKEG